MSDIYIFHGKDANSLETTAIKDLKKDLELIVEKTVEIKDLSVTTISELEKKLPPKGSIILVGTPRSNPIIHDLAEKEIITVTEKHPGKRGGIIKRIDVFSREMLVLGGSDEQGTQYTIYDFARNDLGRDPFLYWTDCKIKTKPDFEFSSISDRIIEPPLVKILGYFDNDNDELANMTKPYLEFSFEHWKEIINSLVRLRYNAIDIHDHLGRGEFYTWPHYQDIRPNYEPNVNLLNKVIDYAHERGVLVQVSFYLGWKFNTISDKGRLNWPKYKEEWKNIWRYYLEHTPIGKCDIFLNRPRDQKWDTKYRGKGKGNDPVSVFNEAFPEMCKILKEHNPEAIIIVDLYMEGRDVYEKEFRPEPKENFIMAWPNDGFGKFEYMPKDMDNYEWGVYMHAGYFWNHVVHDPYPEVLSKNLKKAFLDFKMREYCLVNGQTFRHFILNLETCSELCNSPENFDAKNFYSNWCARYFGSEHAEEILSLLQALHKAQKGNWGYVSLMSHLRFTPIRIRLLKYFKFAAGLINKIYEKIGQLGETYLQKAEENVKNLSKALEKANNLIDEVENQQFFFDHVILQIKLLLELNQIGHNIQLAAFNRNSKKYLQEAASYILQHHETRMKGDRNEKWSNWYDPTIRRPNGGYFDIEKAKKGKIGFISRR